MKFLVKENPKSKEKPLERPYQTVSTAQPKLIVIHGS